MTAHAITAVRRAGRRLEKAQLSLEIAVVQARTGGATWAQIAHALSISIGAVRHRYGSPSVLRSKLDSATAGAAILPGARAAKPPFQQGVSADDTGEELAAITSDLVQSLGWQAAFVFVLDVVVGRKPCFQLLDGGFEHVTGLVDAFNSSKLHDHLVENLSNSLSGDSKLYS